MLVPDTPMIDTIEIRETKPDFEVISTDEDGTRLPMRVWLLPEGTVKVEALYSSGKRKIMIAQYSAGIWTFL